MKLLIYSHFFAPSVGGVEIAVLSLARGLVELPATGSGREFEVTVVTQTPAANFDDSSFPFQVIRRPSWFEVRRLIRAADIVHLAGPALAPLVLAWLTKTPVVVEHHGYQAICPNGLLVHQPDRSVCPGHFQAGHYRECLRCQTYKLSHARSVLGLLFMFPRFWLSRRADANLAITRHVEERQALPNSSVIYYGIEDPLRGEGRSSHFPDNTGKVCFGYVGRLVAEKGIPVLLLAARQLLREGHGLEVRLIGDGPERRNLEEIIRREGLESSVRITGYLNGSALDNAVKDVSVVVMPSVWEETAGLAAIEQMMRGRLVIAANIGGLGEIVGDAGLQFLAGDTTALAECMRRVINEPSLIDSFGRKARERALDLFRREHMIVRHAAIYSQLCAMRRSNVPPLRAA